MTRCMRPVRRLKKASCRAAASPCSVLSSISRDFAPRTTTRRPASRSCARRCPAGQHTGQQSEILRSVFRRRRQEREKQSADHAGSRTAPIIETMIEILAPASPVTRGMVMTDDDIEFDEADLVRLQRLEAMMQDRGYRRDQLRILKASSRVRPIAVQPADGGKPHRSHRGGHRSERRISSCYSCFPSGAARRRDRGVSSCFATIDAPVGIFIGRSTTFRRA